MCRNPKCRKCDRRRDRREDKREDRKCDRKRDRRHSTSYRHSEKDWQNWAQKIIADAEALLESSGGNPDFDSLMCQTIRNVAFFIGANRNIPLQVRTMLSLQFQTMFPECFSFGVPSMF